MSNKIIKLCPTCLKQYRPKSGVELIKVQTRDCIFGDLMTPMKEIEELVEMI